MAGYDDDEHRAAHDRATEFARDNAVFHDIIQHYDDTARPDHDDIDFDPAGIDNLDGTEYDDDGDPVLPIGAVGTIVIDLTDILGSIYEAIEQFGDFDDIPDDYEFGVGPETCGHNPSFGRYYWCDDDDLPAD
jgi:hypothetical protein